MTDENDCSRGQGEHSAFSTIFHTATRLMNVHQLKALLEEVNSHMEATETVNSENPSSLMSGHTDGLKRIQFRVSQMLEIAEGQYLPSDQFKMLCIQCNLPVFDFRKPCTVCKSYKWFEVDRRGLPPIQE